MTERCVDSTRHSCVLACPRKRYYYTEYGGKGIVLNSPNVHLQYGLGMHGVAEELVKGTPFDEAYVIGSQEIDALPEGYTPDSLDWRDELKALLYGHGRILDEYIIPSLKERFEIISVEQELVIPLSDDVSYMTRLDNILRSKDSGEFYNLNWKSSSYMNDLLPHATTSLQLMMEAEALRQHTGKYSTGSIVIGLDKGGYRKVSEKESENGLSGKRLLSPFCYLWRKGKDPWVVDDSLYGVEYKYGWERVPTFALPLTMEKAWNIIPEAKKRGLYVELPPITAHPHMIEALKLQISVMEGRMGMGMFLFNQGKDPKILDQFFPQNFNNCVQDGGFMHCTCPYKSICWDGEEPELLVGGMYQWREANHPYEENFFAT